MKDFNSLPFFAFLLTLIFTSPVATFADEDGQIENSLKAERSALCDIIYNQCRYSAEGEFMGCSKDCVSAQHTCNLDLTCLYLCLSTRELNLAGCESERLECIERAQKPRLRANEPATIEETPPV